MDISVVIPTFNRGQKLLDTLRSILRNRTEGLGLAEVVVVDDGSVEPVAGSLAVVETPSPWVLRDIRQENKGPGAARNAGFRASRGSLLIFMDDDILAPEDLILGHIVAHQSRPGSVICGRCPLLDDSDTPFHRYLQSLGHYGGEVSDEEFIPISLVASGHISFERSMFEEAGRVYSDDLTMPGAEEAELSNRLATAGVAVYSAARLTARHDQQVTLEAFCAQQYKYGLALAEVAAKHPRILEVEAFAAILGPWLDLPSPPRPRSRLGTTLKSLASRRRSRAVLMRLALSAGARVPNDRLLAPLYKAALGSHWIAGILDGRRRFRASGAQCGRTADKSGSGAAASSRS